MTGPQLRIDDCGAHGPQKRVLNIKISLDEMGSLDYTEVVDLFSSTAREDFVSKLVTRYPALDQGRDDVLARLQELAAEVAQDRAQRTRSGESGKGSASIPPNADENAAGRPLLFETVDACPDTVDGEELLDAVEKIIDRFMVLSKPCTVAVALWIVFTWVIDSYLCAPILLLTSPVKRCGKTRLLQVIACLVPRPLTTSSITEAALFRSVERFHPTLLIDEADLRLDDNEGLRAIVNAGHTKSTASVLRCEGDSHEPRVFSVWCPKLVAGIGRRKDTVEDRSILISLQREPSAREKVERLSPERLRAELLPLRQQIAKFAQDWARRLGEAEPPVPNELHDRAQDNWEPLLAIANAAGGKWPCVGREAAIKLSIEEADPGDPGDAGTLLLREMDRLLSDGILNPVRTNDGEELLGTSRIVTALLEDPAAIWQEWGRTKKPLTETGLARILGRFHLSSVRRRASSAGVGADGAVKVRGFLLKPVRDLIARYGASSPHEPGPSARKEGEQRLTEIPTWPDAADVPPMPVRDNLSSNNVLESSGPPGQVEERDSDVIACPAKGPEAAVRAVDQRSLVDSERDEILDPSEREARADRPGGDSGR